LVLDAGFDLIKPTLLATGTAAREEAVETETTLNQADCRGQS
jgi:hypothetical protein